MKNELNISAEFAQESLSMTVCHDYCFCILFLRSLFKIRFSDFVMLLLNSTHLSMSLIYFFQAIDPRTRMVLFKMLNRGVFHEMNGCISTGKEVCVL